MQPTIFLWARVSPAESSNLGHICVQLKDPAASIKWMYNCLYYSSLKISGNEQVFFVENLAPCVHCVAMAHQFQPHTGQIPLASSSHRQWKIFQETHLHPTTKTSVLAYFDSINHHWIKQPTAMCLSSSSKRPAPAFLPHEPSEQNKIHLPLILALTTKMVLESQTNTILILTQTPQFLPSSIWQVWH